MKEIAIIIQHGLVTSVIAEEEVKIIFMNLDGRHEDQKVVMNEWPYYVDEYIADVDKEKLAAIKKVNIGGLPFLPHHTGLVEEIIDNLLNKSADELQREGTVLVVHDRYVVNKEALVEDTVSTWIEIEHAQLPEGYMAVKQLEIGNDQGVYLIGNAQVVESGATKVTFYVDMIEQHILLLKEYEQWSEPFIVERKSFDLANGFVQLFVRGRELELLEMFRRISKGVMVQVDQPQITDSSKVERFIVGDKAFILHQHALICDGVEIEITGRPLYEIFKQVNKMLSTPE